MTRGMNRAMIIGVVWREPEMRYAADGRPVTAFPVAAFRRWTTTGGEDRHSTEWFNVVAWDRLAETALRGVHANQRIYAEGHLQTRTWEAVEGTRSFRTELVVSQLIPLDDVPDQWNEPPKDIDEMPLCLNRAIVIGNVGRDPEMRYTPTGQAVTSFSLAATRSWLNSDHNRREGTEWFNVVSWGSLAEICSQHLIKGRRVYVEGELRTRSWEHTDGTRDVRTELVASEMILLEPSTATSNQEGRALI